MQKKPLNAEAEAEIHHEKTRVMDRLEFAVEVVVDMLTHQKRRRREGKTDFHACKKMTQQRGHKYNSKKYCLAVRFTNRKVIVQVAYAVILGDKTVAQVTSTELPIRTVLEHRSAVYLTGFSGCLTKCGVRETFKGYKEADDGEYHVEDEEDNAQGPFSSVFWETCVECFEESRWRNLHVVQFLHTTKKFHGCALAEDTETEAQLRGPSRTTQRHRWHT